MKPISSHFWAAFVVSKWDIWFQKQRRLRLRLGWAESQRATANTAADPRTASSGGMIFTYSCYVLGALMSFQWAGLSFDARFHLNTHISSPPARRAAEAAARSKIWLYHQASIPAGPLRCLVLILQTGVGGLKLLLQWISPLLCFYLSGKHWCTARPCRLSLPVGSAACLCLVSMKCFFWGIFILPNGKSTTATHAMHFISFSLLPLFQKYLNNFSTFSVTSSHYSISLPKF